MRIDRQVLNCKNLSKPTELKVKIVWVFAGLLEGVTKP